MAGPADNTEELLLDTKQAAASVNAITEQVAKLRKELQATRKDPNQWTADFQKMNKGLKELNQLLKGYGASLTDIGSKFSRVTQQSNAAFERNGKQFAIQANQMERALRQVRDAAKVRVDLPFGETSVKKSAEALKAYEAGLRRVRELTAKVDATGAYSRRGAQRQALVAELDREILRTADLLNLKKRLEVAERQEAAAAVRAQREVAAATRERIRLERQAQAEAARNARASMVPGQTIGQRFGQNVRTFTNYAILGSAFAGVATTAREVVKLDEALHNLQGITQTSDAGMAQLRNTILQVAASSKFLASDLADASTVLGQAGLSVSQINESLGAVATFAQATGIKLEESVNLITSAMGAFKLQASESMEIANLFTAALNESKLTVDQLSQGFQYSATAAAQLGMSYSELATIMALMANAGIKSGSMIGTGIRQIINQLSAPNEKLKRILLSLNVPLDSIDIKSHGLIVVMKNLQEAGFSAAEAFQAFGTRGAGAFIALQNQLGSADEMQRKIIGTQAATKAAETQMKSFANIARNAFASISALASEVFDPVLSFLKLFVGSLGDLSQALRAVAPLLAAFGTALALVAGARAVTYIANLAGIASAISAVGRAIAAIQFARTIGMSFTEMAVASVRAINPWTIALVAAAAAVTGLAYALGYASRKASENRKELENAKGAYDSTVASYKSLLTETQNLIDKKSDLKSGTASLAAQTQYLGDRFKNLGLDIRALGGSYDELLQKMRDLRGESLLQQKNALMKLETAQTAVLADQRGELGTLVGDLRRQYRTGIKSPSSEMEALMSLIGSRGNQGLKITDMPIVLRAAVAERQRGRIPSADAIDNVYSKLNEIGQSEQGLRDIGTNRSSVDVMSRGSFQGFQTQVQETVKNLRNDRRVIDTNPLYMRDAVERAKAIDAWWQNVKAQMDPLFEAIKSFSAASPANKKAIENSGLLQLLTDFKADANVILDRSTADARTQRMALGQIGADDAQQDMNAARDELNRSGTDAAARAAGRKMAAAAISRMNYELEKYAAHQLGLRESEYRVGGGQISVNDPSSLTITQQREINSINSRNRNELGNIQGDVSNKLATLGQTKIDTYEKDVERIVRVQMRGANVSIGNWLRRVTSEFKNLDNYSPPSAVRAASKAALDDLAMWYAESSAAIAKEQQLRIAQLSPGHSPELEQDIVDAMNLKRSDLTDDYQRRQQDIVNQRADNLNDTNRLAANWGDAWELIQQNAADPRKTKSTVSQWATTFKDVMIDVTNNVRSGFANMWAEFVSGSMSAGAAFKSFAKGMLQTMLQTLSNKAAQSFINLLFSFLPTGGGSAPGPGGADGFGGWAGMNQGGNVFGPVTTRDSVPAMLRPGSFVMRASSVKRLGLAAGGRVPAHIMPGERVFSPAEVGAIGLQNLRRFNAAGSGGNGLMSFAMGGAVGANMIKAGAAAGQAFEGNLKMPRRDPDSTNVYVVQEQPQQQMSPNDVLVTVAADILRNGQTKKLIKSVAMGA